MAAVTPALFPELGEAQIVIHRTTTEPDEPGRIEVALPVLPAPGLHRYGSSGVEAAPPGENVHCPSQGVGAKYATPARHDFNALDVFEREEIKIDFVGIGFVDPHPIHKNTQTLWAARERGDAKAAVAEVHLRGGALLVAELRAWEEALQHGLECGQARAGDLFASDDRDSGRYVILSKRPTGQGSRSGDDDLRELQGSLVCPRSGENQGEEAV